MNDHTHDWRPVQGVTASYECDCGVTGYRGRTGAIVEHKRKIARPTKWTATDRTHGRGDGRVGRSPLDDWDGNTKDSDR